MSARWRNATREPTRCRRGRIAPPPPSASGARTLDALGAVGDRTLTLVREADDARPREGSNPPTRHLRLTRRERGLDPSPGVVDVAAHVPVPTDPAGDSARDGC